MHWIVLLLVALLLFGPARLANVGKGLGEGIRNFKKGLEGSEGDEQPKAPPPPAQLTATSTAGTATKDAPRPHDTSVG